MLHAKVGWKERARGKDFSSFFPMDEVRGDVRKRTEKQGAEETLRHVHEVVHVCSTSLTNSSLVQRTHRRH